MCITIMVLDIGGGEVELSAENKKKQNRTRAQAQNTHSRPPVRNIMMHTRRCISLPTGKGDGPLFSQ